MNIQSHLQMDKPTFLAWAEGRELRCELVGGRVIMMTGASLAHGLIAGNLIAMLRARIDRKRRSILADFGVDVAPDTLRYPDAVVMSAGGAPKSYTTESPILIAEILSPTTASIDLGDKASEYLRLPSLAAYIVLAQDERKAWVWVRRADRFPPGPEVIAGSEAVIAIAALGLDLPLSEIYADTGIG